MADKDPFVGTPGDLGSPGTLDGRGGQGGQGGHGGHGERGPAGPPGELQSLHDLYEQVGRLTGRIEELSLKIDENRSRQRCGEHDLRMTRLEEVIGAPKRPPSVVVPSVTPQDLALAVSQMDDSLESKVASTVLSVLQAQRAAEEAQAQERRKAAAEQLAADAKTRWAKLQWIVGIIATLLTSGTVAGHCQTNSRMDEDRRAVVKALREQPPPQIVKVPVVAPVPVPVLAPAPKEEP